MANGKKISMLEYAKTIRHRVIGITVEEWKGKVWKYHKNLKARMLNELIKDMVEYLYIKAGTTVYGVEMPKVRTGNLIDRLLTLKITSVSDPKFKQIEDGDIHIATIKVPYGFDENNGKNTVLRMTGTNSPFPYAKALNEGDRFSRYNGFIEVTHSEFLNKYQKLSSQYALQIFKEKYLK